MFDLLLLYNKTKHRTGALAIVFIRNGLPPQILNSRSL